LPHWNAAMQMRHEQQLSLWFHLGMLMRRLAANIADILRTSPIELLEIGMLLIVWIFSAGLLLPAVSFPGSVVAGTGSLLNAQTEAWWGAAGLAVGTFKGIALGMDYDHPRRPLMRQLASAMMFLFWLAIGSQFYRINPAAPGFFWCVALDTLQGLLFSRQAAINAPPRTPRHANRA